MRKPYSLLVLWRDRRRYFAAVLSVCFSTVLIAVQCGLLFGLLLCASVPIDCSSAEIWITTADVSALVQAQPFPETWLLRAARRPEVQRTESYLLGYGNWHKPGQGANELCIIVGSRLDEGSLGAFTQLTPEIRTRLTEPGTVVVDEWDLEVLGLQKGSRDLVEINHQQVRVVGTMKSYPGLNFAWVVCSLETARLLLPYFGERNDLTMFGLVKCHRPDDAARLAQELRTAYPEMGVATRADFSRGVQVYWLFRSKAGAVMLCTVVLAFLVGLVVTSQTLYGAVLASLREFALLDAQGIPRWRMTGLVLAQSFWIGLIGVALSLPIIFLARWVALLLRTNIILWAWLLAATVLLTMAISLVSGVWALRPLKHIDPATLLR
jgi:putative ABC transport system permease protein